jgi:DNA-binding CsgD family transcriptional regulator
MGAGSTLLSRKGHEPSVKDKPACMTDSFRSFLRDFATDAGEASKRNQSVILLDLEVDGLQYRLCRSPVEHLKTKALSDRQLQIATRIAQGEPNKMIARGLNISPFTVQSHLKCIFWKLGVGSRAEMVAELSREGNFAVVDKPLRPVSPIPRKKKVVP